MDIFNKKKITKLERQLSLKEAECSSLKSDLAFLERENDKLKARLGENQKVATCVKSSKPTLIADSKAPSRHLSNKSTSWSRPQTEGSKVVVAVAAGVLASTVLNDDSDCSSD